MKLRIRVRIYYHVCHFMCGFVLGICLTRILAFILLKNNLHYCQTSHMQQSETNIPDINRHKNKSFIFIGVMTTRQNLETRAAAISRTWGKLVPGKLIFFVGRGDEYSGNLPVVVLNETSDNIYPPQEKSFAMIKYMHDKHGHAFEWFIRADDDVFVKVKQLEVFLRSVNSSRRLYIGQPGLGVAIEKGKLGLRDDRSFYCLGGPGVVLSRETLGMIVQSLTSCLRDVVTTHEDTELGRCVHNRADVSCTSAYEFSTLFYQNYKNKNGSFEGQLHHQLTHALTLHPVKESEHMYRLHNIFNTQRLIQLTQNVAQLQRTHNYISNLLDVAHSKGDSGNVGSTESVSDRHEQTEVWDLIRSGIVYTLNNPFRNPYVSIKRRGRHLGFIASLLSVSSLRSKSSMPVFSYQKLTLRAGLEHIIVVKTRRSVLRSYVTIRRFQSAEIAEHPTKVVERPTNKADSPTKMTDSQTEVIGRHGVMYILLPLFKRSKTFADFLKSLTVAVFNFHSVIVLRVAMYRDDGNDYLLSNNYVKSFNNTNRNLIIELIPMVDQFSRARALERGLENLSSDSLVIAMDVDMRFTADFLHRMFLNTQLGKQACFPIYFIQYDPRTICYGKPECSVNGTQSNFDNQYGTWRHFSYGIVGIYKGDVTKVGGFNTMIEGWGKEDTDFFDKCVQSGLRVFRSIDPDLLHVHHSRICDVNLPRDQFRMCIQSREALYGSQSSLADIVFNISDIN